MSLEVFVFLTLLVIWAALPVSLIFAARDFDNERAHDLEDHH